MLKQKYNQHKETVHNFIWRALQIGGKQGITFAIFFMSAYFLTPESFGLYSYLMALVGLFIIFCDFGISSATSKYVAEYKAKKSKDLNKILFSVSIAIIGLATIISLFIIFFGGYIFEEHKFLLYFIPYLFLFPLTSVLDGVYRGLKEFKKLSIITLIFGGVSLIASYFLIKNYLLIGAIISQNLLFLLLAISLFIFRKESKFKINKNILKKIGKYSLIIGLVNIAFFMYSKIDILILKQFGYVIEIGYYEIVNKIFLILFLPAVILGTVIAPNITRHITNKNYSIIKIKLKKYFFFFLFGGVVLSILLYFIFPLGLKLFLPEYYSPTFLTILNILLILLPFKLWGVFLTNGFITPGGFAKIIAVTTLIGGILNIVFNYVFISWMGFIGVFLVTFIIHSANIIIVSLIFYNKLQSGIIWQKD